jgi:hypothetical protein
MSSIDQANLYFELLGQGISPSEAYAQAFPNGIESVDQKKEAEKAQGAAIGQAAGTIGGAIGGQYLVRKVPELLGIGAVEAAPVAGEVSVIPGALDLASEFAGAELTSAGGVGTGGGFGGGSAAMPINPLWADAGGVAGVVAVPMLAKYLGDKFISDELQRPFIASEAAQSQQLARQIPGFENRSLEEREALATQLHDIGMLAATGKGRVDDETQALVSDNAASPWYFSTANGGRRMGPEANVYEQLATSMYGPGSIMQQKADNPFRQRAIGALGAIFGEDQVDEKLALLKALGSQQEQYLSPQSRRD